MEGVRSELLLESRAVAATGSKYRKMSLCFDSVPGFALSLFTSRKGGETIADVSGPSDVRGSSGPVRCGRLRASLQFWTEEGDLCTLGGGSMQGKEVLEEDLDL